MNALEKIFQGYYEERLDSDRPDSVGMQEIHTRLQEDMEFQKVKDAGVVMEMVSEYGMEAEKTGFMAGFRMAWELLKNMQEDE